MVIVKKQDLHLLALQGPGGAPKDPAATVQRLYCPVVTPPIFRVIVCSCI
jgi:hypothetical protein